jgi:hypothetical protein
MMHPFERISSTFPEFVKPLFTLLHPDSIFEWTVRDNYIYEELVEDVCCFTSTTAIYSPPVPINNGTYFTEPAISGPVRNTL